MGYTIIPYVYIYTHIDRRIDRQIDMCIHMYSYLRYNYLCLKKKEVPVLHPPSHRAHNLLSILRRGRQHLGKRHRAGHGNRRKGVEKMRKRCEIYGNPWKSMEFNDDSYTQFTQMYGNLYLWEHIGKCCGIFLSSTENKFGTRQKTLKQTADVGLKTLEETEF